MTLSCCWTLEEQRFRVSWLRNDTALNSTQILGPEPSVGCLNLTLRQVVPEDSGNYSCRVMVELPTLSVLEGSGTVLTVTGARSPLAGEA